MLSNSGLLKDGSLRVSVTACLPGRVVVEIGREPLQEARHAKQRHRASEDEEAALEVLAEQAAAQRSEEHTSELQSLMRISYAVFCLKKKNTTKQLSSSVLLINKKT